MTAIDFIDLVRLADSTGDMPMQLRNDTVASDKLATILANGKQNKLMLANMSDEYIQELYEA